MVTEYIPVNYGSAEDIAKLLTDESKTGAGGGAQGGSTGSQSRGFLSSRGRISFDRRTNPLLVLAIPDRLSNLQSMVSTLDRPVDHVVLAAAITIATVQFALALSDMFVRQRRIVKTGTNHPS